MRIHNAMPAILAASALAMSGCGVDRETLATPTRAMDPDLPKTEVAFFHNPGFEEVEDGRPAYWSPRKERPEHASATTEEVFSGERALCLKPGPEWYFVRQTVEVDPDMVAGKVLTARVMVKVRGSNNVTVNLTLGEFYRFVSPRHPGDGNWHEMRISCLVPAWWSDGNVSLTLTTGGAPAQPVFFDDIRVTVK